MANCLIDTVLRINFYKQMHMIWHNFHFNDFSVDLRSYFIKQLLYYPVHKNLAPIFWTPNHMIFARINNIII